MRFPFPCGATCLVHLILVDVITVVGLIFVEEYNYEAPQYAAFSILLFLNGLSIYFPYGKVKVKLSLCSTKHHAMKAY
jgi:hypothetical protein